MCILGRTYDPDAVSEAQGGLQSCQGASSILSNQYFGHEEEDKLGGGDQGNEAEPVSRSEGIVDVIEVAYKALVSLARRNG